MTGDTRIVPRQTWESGCLHSDTDAVVTELPVALVYNGISHAVMMATPTDLEDFALGFSLSEGILQHQGQMLDCEMQEVDQGVELLISIAAECFSGLKERRRNLAGRSGCGLCGVESLEQAIAAVARVDSSYQVSHDALQVAVAELSQHQTLKQQTGGVHGAAWCDSSGRIQMLREDVGRHNALDKLIGAMRRGRCSEQGFALVTSRASYEMVAKAARCEMPVLAAVSAPTSLAVSLAQRSNLALVGFVQPGRQVVFANGQRIIGGEQA